MKALALLAVVVLAGSASAQTATNSQSYNPNVDIPDNSMLGVADSHIFSTPIFSISEVRVSLVISGSPSAGDAYNGDFYATLTNGSGFAVLLNRPGRTASDPYGYGESGFNVTFDDQPAGLDIHNYQVTANPNGAALTGVWGTDGRNVAPSMSLDSSPRSASLNSFIGSNPNTTWTLFVADASPLGTGRLVSWQLEVTGMVPEPGTGALLSAGSLALVGACVVRRRSALSLRSQYCRAVCVKLSVG